MNGIGCETNTLTIEPTAITFKTLSQTSINKQNKRWEEVENIRKRKKEKRKNRRLGIQYLTIKKIKNKVIKR